MPRVPLPPVGGYRVQNLNRSYESLANNPWAPQNRFTKKTTVPNQLLIALDTDKDGEISEDELSEAVEALTKLDQNEDGKISKHEIYPEPEHVRKTRETRERVAKIAKNKPTAKESFIDTEVGRVMRFDKNKDGIVTAAEFPDRMQRFLIREDANGDNQIDMDELLQVANRRWLGVPSTPRATTAKRNARVSNRIQTNFRGNNP